MSGSRAPAVLSAGRRGAGLSGPRSPPPGIVAPLRTSLLECSEMGCVNHARPHGHSAADSDGGGPSTAPGNSVAASRPLRSSGFPHEASRAEVSNDGDRIRRAL